MAGLTIAVAGAGPAGLATALLLSRDGHHVVLFDQFEAPGPIGSGLILQPTGLAVLAKLGLSQRVLELGARIERLFGRAVPSGRVALDIRYRDLGPHAFGLAVHRALLFRTLFEAVAAAGISLETGRRIVAVHHSGGRPALIDARGRATCPFDLVVDALGVWSPLGAAFGGGTRRPLRYGAIWATLPWPAQGFDPHALEQRYRRASTMIGVLPTGRREAGGGAETAFFWSLRLQDHRAWREEGLDAWKARVLRLWPDTEPLLAAIRDADQMVLARYAHAMLARPAARRLAAVGDAFHAASPQLGQGANMALLDAQALALALRSHRDLDAALAAYVGHRRWQMRAYQVLSAAFTPFYQSDSRLLPALRDLALTPATRLPVARWLVAASVAGLILDPSRRLGLGGGEGEGAEAPGRAPS